MLSIRRSTRVAVVALAGALLVGAPAGAQRGVSLDLGQVRVTDRLVPGGGYRLPTFGVRNPGDERATYRMVISTITNQRGKEPPTDWFRFDPPTFSLGPGATRAVVARLELPTGAAPGDYEALVGAQLTTRGTGTQVGAAAAARVSFTVEPSSLVAAYWLEVKGFLTRHAPLTWLAPLAVGLVAAAATFRRRFSFRVERRT